MDEIPTTTVIALPPHLARRVQQRAERLGDTPAEVVQRALRAFAGLEMSKQVQALDESRWGIPEPGAWVLVTTYRETRTWAQQCTHRAWSLSEVYVAALSWYLLA